jgi:hypothetical protein
MSTQDIVMMAMMSDQDMKYISIKAEHSCRKSVATDSIQARLELTPLIVDFISTSPQTVLCLFLDHVCRVPRARGLDLVRNLMSTCMGSRGGAWPKTQVSECGASLTSSTSC